MAPVKRGSLLVIAFAATALLIGGASAQQARLEEIVTTVVGTFLSFLSQPPLRRLYYAS